MSLGTNISYLRKQKKITQEQFAEKMNVTRQTVSRWESDEITPELSKLVDMSELFACKLDALIKEELSVQKEIYSSIQIKRISAFKMASYVMISPNPESDVMGYMERWAANNFKEKQQDNIISCFEYEYTKDEVNYMDVFVHVDGVTKVGAFSEFN